MKPRETMKPGPNDPCPCGSGRKYKRCCQGASVQRREKALESSPERGKAKYAFVAGSYKTPVGFTPSIACKRILEDGSEKYHFVLVRYVAAEKMDDAEQMSHIDLEGAFGDGADPEVVAGRLKTAGYVAFDNFQIARDE